MLHISRTFDCEQGALLVEQVGTPTFAVSLLGAAARLYDVQELFGYLVVDGSEPQTIVSASFLPRADERVGQYTKRFFRHDPAVAEIREIAPHQSFVMRIAQNAILAPDYRRHCFARPGFAEKLTFGWRGEGYILALSFYRRDRSDSDEAIDALEPLVALVLPILIHHHRPVDRSDTKEVIERRLRRSYPILSRREIEVCTQTIIGLSAQEIGHSLGIGPGSVLTYRRRAYEKIGISRAGELVGAILR